MNDDRFSDQFLTANAYLDGELTAAERERAEADPAVMAVVEDLRALQGAIRDVDLPSDLARESAVTAAMAEFRAVGASAPAGPAPVRELRHAAPNRLPRYLAIAAAVVGVGVLGVIVAQFGGSGDDDAADGAVTPAMEEGRAGGGELTGPAGDDSAMITGAVGGGGQEAAPSEMADTAAPTADTAADTGGVVAGDATTEILVAGTPIVEPAIESVDQRLPTPEQLAVVGADLVARRDAQTLPPTPETLCVFADGSGEVLGRHEFSSDAGSIELLVGVADADQRVVGVDPETCEIRVQAPLP